MEQEVDKTALGVSGDVLGRNEAWVSIWEQYQAYDDQPGIGNLSKCKQNKTS